MTDALEYLGIAKVYVEFVTQHFGEREINLVLADVVRHVNAERSNAHLQDLLAECALGVVRHYSGLFFLVIGLVCLVRGFFGTDTLLLVDDKREDSEEICATVLGQELCRQVLFVL